MEKMRLEFQLMQRILPQLGKFAADFRAPFVKELTMWGCSTGLFVGEEDLLLRVVKYMSETILISSVADIYEDSKQCGELDTSCHSLSIAEQHIILYLCSQLLISKETVIVGECSAHNVSMHSLASPSAAFVYLNSTISKDEGIFITTSQKVQIESKPSFFLKGDEIYITNVKLKQIKSTTDIFEIGKCGSVVLNGIDADGVKLSEGCIIAIHGNECDKKKEEAEEAEEAEEEEEEGKEGRER
ncbi:uncharacterized protein MONOS_8976 [Monocercomonoides exilis]|uniref:uncharacterized protein n=1 Tax=Monocercomonoides exilis TaxID=2049356 RepID=UPI003559E34C|nr:hypothetical protein MONOS_8976 [Monocercomonoides exilis]|eukprot:MONOS_8976.1-p1 / transcript=MONOS_8976.1 / gene=MONOS_8976 / organism=Monocercomonoides_exilis_PA203 / gene_product=unspecified product / transcript_product=unspecified product / location=Mono_scaffold00354:44887-46386(-) / protein_length=243 / sequence_SO=supercontig / SO=protein_coding / is_pseudo=false